MNNEDVDPVVIRLTKDQAKFVFMTLLNCSQNDRSKEAREVASTISVLVKEAVLREVTAERARKRGPR